MSTYAAIWVLPKIFFVCLGALMLSAYIFTMFVCSWWILPLSIMECPSGSLFMALLLMSILSDMKIATSAFFSCLFAWKICFLQFIFSLCRSFVLRWVSCRQRMCGSWLLTHSAILCLLIGALNPFKFKVIIGRYLSLPFFHTCGPLSLSLFFFQFLKQTF